jgi:hypothetical protein
MHPTESSATFQAALTTAGLTLDGLDASTALAQMTDFYREVRAEKCILDEEGDTLICEWSLRDEGAEACLELEFARHFIEPGDEDADGMSQLSLTLHFAPAPGPALLALEPGTQQCSTPEQLAAFEKTILASPQYQLVAELKPLKVTLDWEEL